MTPGAFCWYELGTTDPDGAKAFYGPLFGWSPVDIPMGPDLGAYTIFRLDGRVVFELKALPESVSARNAV